MKVKSSLYQVCQIGTSSIWGVPFFRIVLVLFIANVVFFWSFFQKWSSSERRYVQYAVDTHHVLWFDFLTKSPDLSRKNFWNCTVSHLTRYRSLGCVVRQIHVSPQRILMNLHEHPITCNQHTLWNAGNRRETILRLFTRESSAVLWELYGSKF